MLKSKYTSHYLSFALIALCIGVVVLGAGIFRLEKRLVTLEASFADKLALVDSTVLTLGEALANNTNKLALSEAETITALSALQNAQADLVAEANISLADIVAHTIPSVVSIISERISESTNQRYIGRGTGFAVTRDGYLVTNKHVVADPRATFHAILQDGTELDAFVIHRSATQDIAIMKVVASFDPIAFSDSNGAQLGETVFAVGNALGEFSNSVSVGVLSGKNRTIAARDGADTIVQFRGVLQTDAAINKGNSGGPLLNDSGDAIGVNVATVIGSDNVSFAIPANIVKEIVEGVLGEKL